MNTSGNTVTFDIDMEISIVKRKREEAKYRAEMEGINDTRGVTAYWDAVLEYLEDLK